MLFIGQERIIKELRLLIYHIQRGENVNILFRAPSGYGKTTLGLLCLHTLKDAKYYLGSDFFSFFDRTKRVHFIDEIHTIKEPESLYPLMDTNKYTFIFASNESGTLKEPLRNRCIQFVFSEYTEGELKKIAKHHLRHNFGDDILDYIVKKGFGNPRIIKNICFRINYITHSGDIPKSREEFISLVENTLDLGEENYINMYLSFLKKVGRAGLETIIANTKLDKDTIVNEIEPVLIRQNKIRISSRGRELVGG